MSFVPDIITRPGPFAAPYTYELGANEVLRPTCAFVHWDGTGASGTFLPCLSFYAQDGTLIMRVFPSTSVSAGGVADVSYAPFPGGMIASGGGTTHATKQVPVPLSTPIGNSNAYPGLSNNFGFTNLRRIAPAFKKSVDSNWVGTVRVPQDYASSPAIVLSFVANATSGVLRSLVGTAVVAAGVSENTAVTLETAVNTTVPGTALQRFDVTFSLSTTPTAGASLNVSVQRNGANVADTLAVDALLWECLFQYST